MEIFNVYCDESCHLENDHQKAMVLGAIWTPFQRCREIFIWFGLQFFWTPNRVK